MATNHTEHYNLSQWVKTDPVRMSDFNEDNAKIDAALHAVEVSVPKIVFGTYNGDGQASQFIDLGFTPKAVYLGERAGANSNGSASGGLALEGHAAMRTGRTIFQIVENGFRAYTGVYSDVVISANSQGCVYYYIAFV